MTCVHALDPSAWPLYCEMVDNDELQIRTFHVDFLANSDREKLTRPGTIYGRMLSTDRLKIFADGSLGGSTAALSKPYNGTDNTGIFIHTQVRKTTQGKRGAHKMGYSQCQDYCGLGAYLRSIDCHRTNPTIMQPPMDKSRVFSQIG